MDFPEKVCPTVISPCRTRMVSYSWTHLPKKAGTCRSGEIEGGELRRNAGRGGCDGWEDRGTSGELEKAVHRLQRAAAARAGGARGLERRGERAVVGVG